jgi:hypothetical protein
LVRLLSKIIFKLHIQTVYIKLKIEGAVGSFQSVVTVVHIQISGLGLWHLTALYVSKDNSEEYAASIFNPGDQNLFLKQSRYFTETLNKTRKAKVCKTLRKLCTVWFRYFTHSLTWFE